MLSLSDADRQILDWYWLTPWDLTRAVVGGLSRSEIKRLARLRRRYQWEKHAIHNALALFGKGGCVG